MWEFRFAEFHERAGVNDPDQPGVFTRGQVMTGYFSFFKGSSFLFLKTLQTKFIFENLLIRAIF